jgi:hypothetical protein
MDFAGPWTLSPGLQTLAWRHPKEGRNSRTERGMRKVFARIGVAVVPAMLGLVSSPGGALAGVVLTGAD